MEGARVAGAARSARDEDLAEMLAWALPRLGLSWSAFRRFRGTLRKRIARRVRELGLAGSAAYRARLEGDEAEWRRLDAMCRITISRLFRDEAVFDALGASILPRLAALARTSGRGTVRVWSAGCASGEEPYTVAMIWAVDVAPIEPRVAFELLATDIDPALLDRARRGTFGPSSLRELPERLARACTSADGAGRRVNDDVGRLVTFRTHDLRVDDAGGPFDLVLCRNVAFTYFDAPLRRRVAELLVESLGPGGCLVLGRGEVLPDAVAGVRTTDTPLVYAREA